MKRRTPYFDGELTKAEREAVVSLLERSIEKIDSPDFAGAEPGPMGTWGTIRVLYESAARKLRGSGIQ